MVSGLDDDIEVQAVRHTAIATVNWRERVMRYLSEGRLSKRVSSVLRCQHRKPSVPVQVQLQPSKSQQVNIAPPTHVSQHPLPPGQAAVQIWQLLHQAPMQHGHQHVVALRQKERSE